MDILNGDFSGDFLQSLTVTPERIQEKSITAQNYIHQMQNDFGNLEYLVNKTKGYWIGEAGDAHREFYMSKKEEIRTVLSRLNEDVFNLQSMAAVYSKTEQAVTVIAEDLPSDVIF